MVAPVDQVFLEIPAGKESLALVVPVSREIRATTVRLDDPDFPDLRVVKESLAGHR